MSTVATTQGVMDIVIGNQILALDIMTSRVVIVLLGVLGVRAIATAQAYMTRPLAIMREGAVTVLGIAGLVPAREVSILTEAVLAMAIILIALGRLTQAAGLARVGTTEVIAAKTQFALELLLIATRTQRKRPARQAGVPGLSAPLLKRTGRF